MEKQTMISQLNSGIYDLEFTKLDGAIRKMIATRNMSYIPEDYHPTGVGGTDKVDAQYIAVFDLEACGWRTVYPDRVISMSEVSVSATLHVETNKTEEI